MRVTFTGTKQAWLAGKDYELKRDTLSSSNWQGELVLSGFTPLVLTETL
jgi:hypothetical protein